MNTQAATRRASPIALNPRVSVVIPCLNEAGNIEECVGAAWNALDANGITGEVVVADNGSTDGSAEIARAAGARVVHEPRRGYGSAYLAGFAAARGTYIVMADADLTYDFAEIPRFVQELDDGAQLVMGDRMDSIHDGAMPWLNRHVGNPALSGFLNLLYKTNVRDVHCGMRALRRDVLPLLDLNSTGMEFASEMVIRASKHRLDVREFPIEYHPRGGESKLSPMRDGWRHLRLMLVYSPTALFIVPGLLMMILGALVSLAVFGHLSVSGRAFYAHTLIGGSLLIIVGTQVVGLGLCGRAYGHFQLGVRDPLFQKWDGRIRLEHGLLLGGVGVVLGLIFGAVIVGTWVQRGFGTLAEEQLAILAATAFVAGIQVFFTSFLLSLIGTRRRD
jgi:glycosyltransferase involved in cell wall biosynthesis